MQYPIAIYPWEGGYVAEVTVNDYEIRLAKVMIFIDLCRSGDHLSTPQLLRTTELEVRPLMVRLNWLMEVPA